MVLEAVMVEPLKDLEVEEAYLDHLVQDPLAVALEMDFAVHLDLLEN